MRMREREHLFVSCCRVGLSAMTFDLAEAATVAFMQKDGQAADKALSAFPPLTLVRQAAIRDFLQRQFRLADLTEEND